MKTHQRNLSDESWEDIGDEAPRFYYKQIDERMEPYEYQGNYHPNIPTVHCYICYEDRQINLNYQQNQYMVNIGASVPFPQLETNNNKQYEPLSVIVPETKNNVLKEPDEFHFIFVPSPTIPNELINQEVMTMPIPITPTNSESTSGTGNIVMPTPWQDSHHGNYQNTPPAPIQDINFIPKPLIENQPHFIAPCQPHPLNPNSYFEPNYMHIPQYAPLPPGAPNVVPVSNFTGRKKALLIGINYFNTKYELKGCINDVKNIQRFLNTSYQFPLEGMVLLTDDQINNPSRIPTKQNILMAIKWLVDGARANDSLFFHFSGHGSQTPDLDGDEIDGYDETICPLDFETQGQIIDDQMNEIMVQPLPQGCRLTAIFDCCHSGTALDLPYIYSSTGKLKAFNPAKCVLNTLVDLGVKTQMGDLVGALQTLKSGVDNMMHGKRREKEKQLNKGGLADVIMFSGCQDGQTSADINDVDLGNTGAMSMAIITALYRRSYNLSYIDLLQQIRNTLAEKKYTQIPQLSTARPMDMNSIFRM